MSTGGYIKEVPPRPRKKKAPNMRTSKNHYPKFKLSIKFNREAHLPTKPPPFQPPNKQSFRYP